MKKDSPVYVVIYALLVAVVCGSLLALTFLSLKPTIDNNRKLERQKSILATVFLEKLPKDPNKVQSVYKEQVTGVVVNAKGQIQEGKKAEEVDVAKEYGKIPSKRMLPVYQFYNSKEEKEEGKKVAFYVFPIYGFGLWDNIWGYVALDAKDMNTVKGVVLAQAGETPGLGARISDLEIQKRFRNKSIFEGETLASIEMQKGEKGGGDASIKAFEGEPHQVDGMSGATITAQGVNVMFKEYLVLYEPFIKAEKASKNVSLSAK